MFDWLIIRAQDLQCCVCVCLFVFFESLFLQVVVCRGLVLVCVPSLLKNV